MSEITIYHYNRCSKSRNALSILKEKGIEPDVRLYMEEVPSAAELKDLLKKLSLPAKDLVRKTEKIYKEKYKDKDLSEEEWIEVLVENPRLIQRPVVIKDNKAIIARPPEKVEELF